MDRREKHFLESFPAHSKVVSILFRPPSSSQSHFPFGSHVPHKSQTHVFRSVRELETCHSFPAFLWELPGRSRIVNNGARFIEPRIIYAIRGPTQTAICFIANSA